jgi:hypothetical protein
MTTKTKRATKTPEQKLLAKVAKLEAEIVDLKARPVRDRGPKSTRTMTVADAEKVVLGAMKDLSHKAAAVKLGLSYGQIYSARFGFTFKPVYKKLRTK